VITVLSNQNLAPGKENAGGVLAALGAGKKELVHAPYTDAAARLQDR